MTAQIAKLAKSSITDEYITPDFILDFAKDLMNCDRFSCDPASISLNPVGAEVFYTKENSGLDNSWNGNVWVNPPFSENLPFAKKLITELEGTELERCVYLAKADYRTAWANILCQHAKWMFFYRGYIQFIGSNHSAVFSVVLYGYNLDEISVRKSLKKHPRFTGMKILPN